MLRESVGARIALPVGLADETGAELRRGAVFGGGVFGALPAGLAREEGAPGPGESIALSEEEEDVERSAARRFQTV